MASQILSSSPAAVDILRNGMRTKVEHLRSTQIWQIQKYSTCSLDVGEKLVSPKFIAGANGEEIKWNLVLYPRGKTNEFKDFLSLYIKLYPHDSDNARVQLKLQFSVLNSSLTKVGTMAGISTFSHDKEVSNWALAFCGWDTFLKKDFLLKPQNDLLPNDTLSICCDILVEAEPLDFFSLRKSVCVCVPDFQLPDNIATFYNSKTYSDVSLASATKVFPAHKAILVANSQVFSELFEEQPEVVDVSELSESIVSNLLFFMYHGTLQNVEDIKEIVGLMVASEKFMLGRLKALCEEYLVSHVTVENVADMLILSDAHGAAQLKEYSLSFINKHASEVIETESWRDVAVKRPKILLEAFKSIMIDNKKKPHAPH